MAPCGHRLAAIYRSLGHLHGAGVAWPEAVEKAAGHEPAFAGVAATLARGETLSKAAGDVLPALDIAALRAGEASGDLEKALGALADRHDAEAARERERKATTAYPFFVAHFAAILMPIPDLVQGNTAGAIGWAALVLVPLYAWAAYRTAARRALENTRAGARPPAWARLLWTRASVEEADGRALRALGWLENAGVPLLEAVPLASHAGAGGRASEDLVTGYAAVLAGKPLSTAWSRLPPDLVSSLRTGESTGRLGEACVREADALDATARLRRARSAALAKPLLIVILGIVVGARVLSFYAGAFSRAGLR
jgi:type II secretory pathway component PulF